MAASGAAAISLRAIAREMGVTAAALYSYYDTRDALVTALLLDAWADLAAGRLHGLVTLESHQFLQALITHPDRLYQAELEALLDDLGLQPPVAQSAGRLSQRPRRTCG